MSLTTNEKIRRIEIFSTDSQRIVYEIGSLNERLRAYKYYTDPQDFDQSVIGGIEAEIDKLYNQFNAHLQEIAKYE